MPQSVWIRVIAGVYPIACWLVQLSSCCAGLLVVLEVVSGVGGSRFLDGSLGGTDTGNSDIAEFWEFSFGAVHGASSSSRDGAAAEENGEVLW